MGPRRFREYPTTFEECFRGHIAGAIYLDQVNRARAEKRVLNFPWDRGKLVYTFWDIGSPWNTVVWYGQFVGREIHWIDCDFELDLHLTDRWAHMLAKGYPYGGHYLPHDAGEKETGTNFEREFREHGAAHVRVLPRTTNIWDGINRTLELFPRMVFHATNCERGITALENYRTVEDTRKDYITDRPVHDWASHPADALRMFSEAEALGLLEGMSGVAKDSRGRRRPRRAITGSMERQSPLRRLAKRG